MIILIKNQINQVIFFFFFFKKKIYIYIFKEPLIKLIFIVYYMRISIMSFFWNSIIMVRSILSRSTLKQLAKSHHLEGFGFFREEIKKVLITTVYICVNHIVTVKQIDAISLITTVIFILGKI